jgi:hypothetical protein
MRIRSIYTAPLAARESQDTRLDRSRLHHLSLSRSVSFLEIVAAVRYREASVGLRRKLDSVRSARFIDIRNHGVGHIVFFTVGDRIVQLSSIPGELWITCQASGVPPLRAPLFMIATRGRRAWTMAAGPDIFMPWCVVRSYGQKTRRIHHCV